MLSWLYKYLWDDEISYEKIIPSNWFKNSFIFDHKPFTLLIIELKALLEEGY